MKKKMCFFIVVYHQNDLTLSAVLNSYPVHFLISSTVNPVATSVRTSSPSQFLNTAFSVMRVSTTPLPVKGREH